MKRLIPLWITALGGFVLIVAYFIPATQGWGELAAIWFDIMAAIAFVLGGGNLLKIHLKKVSDRNKGWGYSLITVLSFLLMLYVGLVKFGSPPAPNQEFFGESFAHLPLASIPESQVFRIAGAIPERPDGEHLHPSVDEQISEENGQIVFRGWMRGDQLAKLLAHREHLDWQCTVNQLFRQTRPAAPLAGKVAYYADHDALGFTGHMTDEHRQALLAMNGDENWQQAVEALYQQSQRTVSVTVGTLAPFFDVSNPPANVSYDASAGTLSILGPMSVGQRGTLADMFPRARPLDDAARAALLGQLRSLGEVAQEQEDAFNKILEGSWKVTQLIDTLNEAGKPQTVDRTACEMREDQLAGVTDIPLKKTVGETVTLNPRQEAAIRRFAADRTMSVNALVAALKAAGTVSANQETVLRDFLGSVPTVGERNKLLAIAMMKVRNHDDQRLALNAEQLDVLLEDYRAQAAWRQAVGRLFVAAHVIKHPWSGEYRAQGNPFWWLYEYAFKPLQATIFAMLAFYVASAAFRAFRAKNIEAILLLGTAFIILLGRTFAGVFLTAWVPEWASGLKIENMTVYIMQVFNTAGNRAIMIGIALGIASTSLKVLLGVDRSYLGGGED